MEEKTINVAKAFSVIIDGAAVKVEAGIQKVPAVVADHWYTQTHLVKGGFGTEEYAAAARQAADAAFFAADVLVKKYHSLEEAVKDAEVAAALEPSEPAFTRIPAARKAATETPAEADPEAAADEAPAAEAAEAAVKDAEVAAGEEVAVEAAPEAAADPYPNLSPAQEAALDRDGDNKPGGAPAGGNRRRGGL